ncbi:C-C motif chemokine 14-like [Ictalurus furcatus]|uniref:C-C motif chemokine 14-like n=1 Tax=Ictalurus furcatus TaxID=66913 RepID=UPI00234FBB2B|nr:C-C motif chemokine 14-like [Ictalurus furcatus]
MKMNRVVLVLGFVLIMALDSDAKPDAVAPPKDCCFKFFPGKILPQTILEVKKIDSRCPQQGFVVTTHEFHSVCVRKLEVTE